MALVAGASASSYGTAHASVCLFHTPPLPIVHHNRPSLQRRRGLFNRNGFVIARPTREVRPNAGRPGLLLNAITDASETAKSPAEQLHPSKDSSGLAPPLEEGRAASGGEQEGVVGEGSGRVDHVHCSTSPIILTVPRADIAHAPVIVDQREEAKLPIDLNHGRAGREGKGGGERESSKRRTEINGARRRQPRRQAEAAPWVRVPTSSRERRGTTQQNWPSDRVSQSSRPAAERSQHPTRQPRRRDRQQTSPAKEQNGRRSLSSPAPLGAQLGGEFLEFSGSTEQRTASKHEPDHNAESAFATGARGGELNGEGKVEEAGMDFSDVEVGPVAESYERGRWLLGLLVLQSTSSFVLDKYQVRTWNKGVE